MSEEAASASRPTRIGGWLRRLLLLLAVAAAVAGGWWWYQGQRQVEVLKRMISRLTAEDRVAEVLVVSQRTDDTGQATHLRLKILEYGPRGRPLQPVFCDFSLNDVIHFEALVIRLNDELVMGGEGKSIHFFRRAYALDDDGNRYESCDINKPMEIPGGYSLGDGNPYVSRTERQMWQNFWHYALDQERRRADGVKNAQIEAPATRFVTGKIYRLVLEHDGGLTISASDVPAILRGEHLDEKEGGD